MENQKSKTYIRRLSHYTAASLKMPIPAKLMAVLGLKHNDKLFLDINKDKIICSKKAELSAFKTRVIMNGKTIHKIRIPRGNFHEGDLVELSSFDGNLIIKKIGDANP